MQALLFSNRPILSKKDEQKFYTLYRGMLVRTYENYKVDYGLLTKTYIDCNNESRTISRFSDRKINFYYCEK